MDTQPIEILLAEDNEDDIVIIQEALGESKLLNLVKIVRDGEEVLAYLRREGEFKNSHLPGLVLLDINMPSLPSSHANLQAPCAAGFPNPRDL